MKIKRFNNLWIMGLILSASILGIIYLLKIFFPQFVIEVAQIDSITRIGHYIDTHKWAWYVATIIISIFSYYFYCCACCKKRTINKFEFMIIISTIIVLLGIKILLPNLYTMTNLVSLIVIPFIMKADFKATTICFTASNILQILTLEIRNIAILVTDFNFATAMILMIDYYILEVLLYFYFNYEEKK